MPLRLKRQQQYLPTPSDRKYHYRLISVFPKNALTSIFFLAMYQYIWFGDIYDTEAEKTLTLHMPAQVIACPPLSHRLVYLLFCLFAWTPTLHMPGQVIVKVNWFSLGMLLDKWERQDKEIPPRLKSIIPVTVSPASPPPSGRKLAVGSKLPRHRLILAQANSLTRSRQASKTKRNFSSSQTQPRHRLILSRNRQTQPQSTPSSSTGSRQGTNICFQQEIWKP